MRCLVWGGMDGWMRWGEMGWDGTGWEWDDLEWRWEWDNGHLCSRDHPEQLCLQTASHPE